jgi:hypothetical protein
MGDEFLISLLQNLAIKFCQVERESFRLIYPIAAHFLSQRPSMGVVVTFW